MLTFTFKAKNKRGHTVRGEYEAPNETELYNHLEKIGLTLIDARAEEYRRPLIARDISSKELQILCKQFFYLVRASINIREAVDSVRMTLNNARLRGALIEVKKNLDNGSALADAFAALPHVFPTLFTAMIRAGEKSGEVTFAFGKLEEYYGWLWTMRRHAYTSLRYPFIALLVASGLVFVVPVQLYYIVVEGTLAVPPELMAKLPISPFMFAYWPFIVCAPFALYYLLRFCRRASTAFAYALDRFLRSSFLFGAIITKIEMARYALFLSMQYEAGIPIKEALHNASAVVKNRALSASLAAMAEYTERGNTPSKAAAITADVPLELAVALKNGEATGFFDKPLMHLHQLYTSQAHYMLDAAIEYSRYALLLLAGIAVLFMGMMKPMATIVPLLPALM